jgi:hypothetical protein
VGEDEAEEAWLWGSWAELTGRLMLKDRSLNERENEPESSSFGGSEQGSRAFGAVPGEAAHAQASAESSSGLSACAWLCRCRIEFCNAARLVDIFFFIALNSAAL